MYCCKYCCEESDNYDEFISPCCCLGSNEFVHKNCLNQWLNSQINGSTNYYKCSECKCDYKRKYDDNIFYDVSYNTNYRILIFQTLLILLTAFATISSLKGKNSFLIFIISILLLTMFYIYIIEQLPNYFITIFIILMCLSTLINKRYISVAIYIINLVIYSKVFLVDWYKSEYQYNLKERLKSCKDKLMYDKYLSKYVGGII
jgi:hypothetical protein